MMTSFARNSAAHGFLSFGIDDPRQGIVHVIGPEQGFSQPGMTIVCGDSHTSHAWRARGAGLRHRRLAR